MFSRLSLLFFFYISQISRFNLWLSRDTNWGPQHKTNVPVQKYEELKNYKGCKVRHSAPLPHIKRVPSQTFCVEFTRSPRAYMDSLPVLRLPPTIQKHACQVNWRFQLSNRVNVQVSLSRLCLCGSVTKYITFNSSKVELSILECFTVALGFYLKKDMKTSSCKQASRLFLVSKPLDVEEQPQEILLSRKNVWANISKVHLSYNEKTGIHI